MNTRTEAFTTVVTCLENYFLHFRSIVRGSFRIKNECVHFVKFVARYSRTNTRERRKIVLKRAGKGNTRRRVLINVNIISDKITIFFFGFFFHTDTQNAERTRRRGRARPVSQDTSRTRSKNSYRVIAAPPVCVAASPSCERNTYGPAAIAFWYFAPRGARAQVVYECV